MSSLLALSFLLGASPAISFAGPNSDAKILLHLLTPTTKGVCGRAEATAACSSLVTAGSLYPQTYYAYVVVVDGDLTEGVAGVQFGIEYNPAPAAGVDMYDWTSCGTLEFSSAGWPESGSGNLVTWDATSACQRAEPEGVGTGVKAVVGYFYCTAYSPDILKLTPRPVDQVAAVASCNAVQDVLQTDLLLRDPSPLGFCAFADSATDLGYLPCGGGEPLGESLMWTFEQQGGGTYPSEFPNLPSQSLAIEDLTATLVGTRGEYLAEYQTDSPYSVVRAREASNCVVVLSAGTFDGYPSELTYYVNNVPLWTIPASFTDFALSSDGTVIVPLWDRATLSNGSIDECVSIITPSGNYQVLEYGRRLAAAEFVGATHSAKAVVTSLEVTRGYYESSLIGISESGISGDSLALGDCRIDGFHVSDDGTASLLMRKAIRLDPTTMDGRPGDYRYLRVNNASSTVADVTFPCGISYENLAANRSNRILITARLGHSDDTGADVLALAYTKKDDEVHSIDLRLFSPDEDALSDPVRLDFSEVSNGIFLDGVGASPSATGIALSLDSRNWEEPAIYCSELSFSFESQSEPAETHVVTAPALLHIPRSSAISGTELRYISDHLLTVSYRGAYHVVQTN